MPRRTASGVPVEFGPEAFTERLGADPASPIHQPLMQGSITWATIEYPMATTQTPAVTKTATRSRPDSGPSRRAMMTAARSASNIARVNNIAGSP